MPLVTFCPFQEESVDDSEATPDAKAKAADVQRVLLDVRKGNKNRVDGVTIDDRGRKRMDETRKREHERSVICCARALLRSMKRDVDWSEIIELDRHLRLL